MNRSLFLFRKLFQVAVVSTVATLPMVMGPMVLGQEEAKDILKLPPRPARPALTPSAIPLDFIKGERIAFLGNSQAERMNLFGNFETLLHLRFPDRQLVIRNFARPAEEVGIQQRSADYTALDDPQLAFGADTYFCVFGYNESFAGPEGVEAYKAKYNEYLDKTAKQYPRDDTGAAPRFILVSPIAFEATGDPLLPDGVRENANLKLYAKATAEVAAARKLAYIDLFEASNTLFAKQKGMQFTINGCHLNEQGDYEVARLMEKGMFNSVSSTVQNNPRYDQLRAAVNDKSWVHLQDYRMLNGWYVYGGRRTFDKATFPREYAKIRKMAEVRDRYVWDIAQGKKVTDKPIDDETVSSMNRRLDSAIQVRSIPRQKSFGI